MNTFDDLVIKKELGSLMSMVINNLRECLFIQESVAEGTFQSLLRRLQWVRAVYHDASEFNQHPPLSHLLKSPASSPCRTELTFLTFLSRSLLLAEVCTLRTSVSSGDGGNFDQFLDMCLPFKLIRHILQNNAD